MAAPVLAPMAAAAWPYLLMAGGSIAAIAGAKTAGHRSTKIREGEVEHVQATLRRKKALAKAMAMTQMQSESVYGSDVHEQQYRSPLEALFMSAGGEDAMHSDRMGVMHGAHGAPPAATTISDQVAQHLGYKNVGHLMKDTAAPPQDIMTLYKQKV